MFDLKQVEAKALAREELTFDEARAVLEFCDDEILLLLQAAYNVRRKFVGKTVQVQMLKNIKSGNCSEDCRYCSQSCVSAAEIEKYPLRALDVILEGAKRARDSGAIRYCMAMSSIRYDDAVIDALADALRVVKRDVGIQLCCSLGFLTKPQAEKLKAAGLDRVNHNLNTSRGNYHNICTTHTFDERIENINQCKGAGLEVCSGGIVGMGETNDDIIEMFRELRAIEPDSIPINFLMPIEGTPFADRFEGLTPMRCLKILCLARFLNPATDIRVAGGREMRLGTLQPLALYPANSIFVSGYLTTDGQSVDEGMAMIDHLGFTPEIEGAE